MMILFLILLLLNDLISPPPEHYPIILFAKVVKLACNRTYS